MTGLAASLARDGLRAGALTFGDVCRYASELGLSAGEVTLEEASLGEGLDRETVTKKMRAEFAHNMGALEAGLSGDSRSFLFGSAAGDLAGAGEPLSGNALLDKSVRYTLAAQVGNHCRGLRPCAGTGDSCPYTGIARAMEEEVANAGLVARATAVMLKIGLIYRAAKSTTGCNLEGFGAGAVAAAAAFSEVFGSDAARTERACVLAASPTVGVPCTPRVMVSGLCAAHIGGAVVLGWTAAWISRWSDIPVSVPFDQMMALAAATHPISARHIVPTVIGYMEPFFKTNAEVDRRVATSVIEEEKRRRIRARDGALAEARALAAVAGSIVRPFGEAVVGGSSQAVGSPANTARIAHAMSTGKIRGMTIELYSELFARRAINVPAIVMCGLYGASTADGAAYASAMERAGADGVTVEVLETGTPQLQKITLRTDDGVFMAAALNRGGARLVLVDASPSLTRAREEAEKMGLETVER